MIQNPGQSYQTIDDGDEFFDSSMFSENDWRIYTMPTERWILRFTGPDAKATSERVAAALNTAKETS